MDQVGINVRNVAQTKIWNLITSYLTLKEEPIRKETYNFFARPATGRNLTRLDDSDYGKVSRKVHQSVPILRRTAVHFEEVVDWKDHQATDGQCPDQFDWEIASCEVT